ncbi:uncharacterized protein LOC135098440 isoform X1 [Scylla paramamosain]|uniref:uncharacterized protein LOC135098440 isoform X1 n=2 Tax=Scylla paramamosain TaxID=85552 RepID=UPI003083A302
MQQLCLSLLVSDPIEPPPKEAPPKATEEEGSVVILDAKLFYKQQEKEVAEKIKESLAVTEYAKPSSALVLSGVSSSVVQYTVFEMQLSFTVLDTEDWWCIPHIWSSRSTPWSSPCTPICSDGSSWRVWRMWIYLPKNNLSTIPVDVVISEVSVRYQLAAQVSVVPAGWHLHFVSPGNQVCMCLVVYPENLKIQENSVTKNLQMNVIGWLMAAPQVNPEITGLIKYSMMGALEKLCLELKAAVTFRKEQSCNKSSKYFVKKVYVEGNLLHCSQENSGTHGCLQDPQRIGRHKFNLG